MCALAAVPMDHAEDLTDNDRKRSGLDGIYREHYDYVRRTLRYLGVPESRVLDALQDVFMVVHRRLDGFEARSTIRTWLFGIAMRVAHSDRRRHRRSAPPDVLCAPVAVAGPEEAVADRQAAELLASLLQQLDEHQRTVFILAEVEQMSAPEIAEALELKVNTVYSRLRLGRRKFERALARHRAQERGARRSRAAGGSA